MSTAHRRKSRRAWSGAAIALSLLAATACGQEKIEKPTGPIEQYVALGDSYAAGPGIPPVTDVGCVRSGANYGAQVAAALGVEDYTDMTCGGAKTSNLVDSQESKGKVVNKAQLSAVNEKTDLVTLGIGLNDNGLSAQVLYLCLPQFNFAKECAAYLDLPGSQVIASVAVISKRLKVAIESIRDLAPRARIVLIGYPDALPRKNDCPAELPLSKEAGDRLRFTIKATDEAYRELARKEQVQYLSTYDLSVGHELCSKDPWVNGVTDRSAEGQGSALHPTPAFMKAVAGRIVALVGS